MPELFKEALYDSARLLPFLFFVYLAIEVAEFKFGNFIRSRLAHANKKGPLFGALFGSIPQCGFSVVGTALYTRRLTTLGTLLAIYLSTSDEALPIILSQGKHISLIIPLLLTKITVALVCGFAIDRLFFKKARAPEPSESDLMTEAEHGCCQHHVTEGKKKIELLIHPIRHTLTVFIFLLITSFIINVVISRYGMENLGPILMKDSILQPVITALIGLIPNCAASVAITQIYLEGGISYGSLISGLSASAGLGLLLLIKENKNIADTLKVIGLLLFISILTGIIFQAVL